MAHDRHDDEFDGLTRREALLAAGAGGLSMMGFCSACEAGEDRTLFGASTPMKNISKLAPDNPVIKQLDFAASRFQNGDYSSPQLSHDNVVSRIQEIIHSGETARKLGRSRSVVRVAAAPLAAKDKVRAHHHLGSQGFTGHDFRPPVTEIYFTRTSLLEQTKIPDVRSFPVSRLTEEVPVPINWNINTIMAVSYDQGANALHLRTVLNAGRGAVQVTFRDLAVTQEMSQEFGALPEDVVDPPQLSSQLVASLARSVKVNAVMIKFPASSRNTSSESAATGDLFTSQGLTTSERRQCFLDCISERAGASIATMGGFCGGCATAIQVGTNAMAAWMGKSKIFEEARVILPCAGCAALTGATFLTCWELCTS